MVAFSSRGSTQCPRTNVTMLHIAAGGVSPITFAWCQKIGGFGAPIVTTTDGTANPIVWAVGAEGNNLLHGFNALTGAVVFNRSRAQDGGPAPFRDDPGDRAALLRRGRRYGVRVQVCAVAFHSGWKTG